MKRKLFKIHRDESYPLCARCAEKVRNYWHGADGEQDEPARCARCRKDASVRFLALMRVAR